MRIEADNSYTHIYFTNDNKLTTTKNLKYFEGVLNNSWFFRIHKSHLINLYYFKEYLAEDGGYALMSDGGKLDISRHRIHNFFDAINHITFNRKN